MNEQERAEEHLRTIRRLMERATIYRAISAPTALVGGLLSLAACGIALAWNHGGFDTPSAFQMAFIELWLLVFLLTAGTNTLFIVMGSKKRNEPVFSASMKAALVALAPALIAGAAFTLCLAMAGEVGLCMTTSVWGIFYGLGLLATSHFAPRSLMLLGWAFFVSGIAALLYLFLAFGRSGLPGLFEGLNQLVIFFMAATFGLFHLIYAACAWPRKGAPPEP